MKTGGMSARRVPVTPEDFHGDARNIYGNVQIVNVNGFLSSDIHPHSLQLVRQNNFGGRSPRLINFSRLGAQGFFSGWDNPSPSGGMSGGNLAGALSGGHPAPLESLGLGLITTGNAILAQDPGDYRSVCPEPFGKLQLGFAASVQGTNQRLIKRDTEKFPRVFQSAYGDLAGDQSAIKKPDIDSGLARQFVRRFSSDITSNQIVKIRNFNFEGYVYDLQAQEYELYVANGIISHNCRCGILYVNEDGSEIYYE
jgi:hypothetical protein